MAVVKSVHDEPTRPRYQTYGEGSILGSYRLIQQIGAGGMGRVFVAEHIRLGRKVAVKILRPEYSGNQEAVKRFFAEARAVNRINHENIIEISDFIEGETGPSFYIMELLEGVDLRALGAISVGLPLARAVRIALQVVSALGDAHEAGIIHRDLKPENIFLVERRGRKDFVKLLDFGVAKLANAKLDDAGSFKSIDGVVVGTPEYMAPEQALGEAVDFRADIYSFGVILFEMITGRPPFKADSAREHMAKHIMATPPRPARWRVQAREVPALEELILECLAKKPEDRPQRMKDIERRLQKILESLPDGGDHEVNPRPSSRRRWVWTGVAAVASIGVGTVLALATSSRSRSTAGPSAVSANASHPPSAWPGTAVKPVPARVQITFDSVPPGASVFREGGDRPLGVTPFVASFDASSDTVTFEYRLEGWRVERTSLALATDAEIKIPLVPFETASSSRHPHERSGKRKGKHGTKEPETVQPAPEPPAVKLDHDIVLNPFE
ncbi:MAG TPA: serine/threonine-protein kinase [Polyangia bacterium]